MPLANIAGGLGGLMQSFGSQSPVNIMAMIAQMGVQNPEQLAQILARKGAQPPTAGGVGPGMLSAPAAVPTLDAAALAQGTVTPPAPGGVAPTAHIPGPPRPGEPPLPKPGNEILDALSQLKVPPPPELAPPPGAIGPQRGGPAADPRLLAQLISLLQGSQPPQDQTLAQLMSGRSAPASPTLRL